jgi:hypothetical protein
VGQCTIACDRAHRCGAHGLASLKSDPVRRVALAPCTTACARCATSIAAPGPPARDRCALVSFLQSEPAASSCHARVHCSCVMPHIAPRVVSRCAASLSARCRSVFSPAQSQVGRRADRRGIDASRQYTAMCPLPIAVTILVRWVESRSVRERLPHTLAPQRTCEALLSSGVMHHRGQELLFAYG